MIIGGDEILKIIENYYCFSSSLTQYVNVATNFVFLLFLSKVEYEYI